MRKITLFLMSLFLTVGAMAQVDSWAGRELTFTNVQNDGTTFTLFINDNGVLDFSTESAANLGDAAKFFCKKEASGKYSFFNEEKGLYMIWRGYTSGGHNDNKGTLAKYNATYCDWEIKQGRTISGVQTFYILSKRGNNSAGSIVLIKNPARFDAYGDGASNSGDHSNLFRIDAVAVSNFEQNWTNTNPPTPWGSETIEAPEGMDVECSDAGTTTIRMAETAIEVTRSTVTARFVYTGGNHKLHILGVDIVNADGNVVASDYHSGTSGSSLINNIYRIKNVQNGEYKLRYFVCNNESDHKLTNTAGTITIIGAESSAAATRDLEEAIAAAESYFEEWVGTTVGKYSSQVDYMAVYNEAVTFKESITSSTSIADIKARTNNINELIATFEINLPKPGGYYRLGYNFDGTIKYVQGVGSSVVKDNMNTLLMTADKEASSIFYYGDGKLLSYTAGKFVNEKGNTARGLMAIGSEGGAASFQEGSQLGTIVVKVPNYMHANTSGSVNFVDHCGSAGCVQHNFIIEEVKSLPVTITAAKYATFYAPVAVTVPAGVTAHTVTINGDYATLSEALEVIPANTGVVLQGEANTYNFAITTTDATATSALVGTTAATYIAADAYVLSNVANGVGFYGAILNQQNNTAFLNNSHKAYLPMTDGMNAASYSFRFPGTTGVENVVVENEVKVIYDLTGRRVSEITEAGVYIVNGKKVLVK